jgi:NADH-quinone oxidoreductase subunit N
VVGSAGADHLGGVAMTQHVDWAAIAAPLCVAVAALLALAVDLAVPRLTRWLPCAVSVAGAAAALALIALDNESRSAFCVPSQVTAGGLDCSWQVDGVTFAWWVLVAIGVGLVALLLQPLVGPDGLPAGETYFLLLTSAAGAMALAASRDLITLVVSMETVTLPTFALVGLRYGSRGGSEAALKFFLISVVSTAVTLLGISLVYGGTGSVMAGTVSARVLDGSAASPIIEVGMALTIVGLAFKVAAVPFQVWVPDTYVGAPIPVAAYLSVVSKAAGLAGIAIVLVAFVRPLSESWTVFVAVSAALTMTVGNLAALRQRHLVRLLAWSSVAQAGYLLVPIAAGGSGDDIGALQAYALMYAIVNIGAFAVVAAVSASGAVDIDDVTGLVRRQPLLGLAFVFSLLCLAGLPPGVIGLLAKVVVFQSAVDGDLTWLAVVMAVNVAIGLVYYLRVIVALAAPSADAPAERSPSSAERSPSSAERSPSSAERPSSSAEPATVVLVDLEQATSVKPERVPLTVRAVVFLTLAASVVLSIVPGPLFSVFP